MLVVDLFHHQRPFNLGEQIGPVEQDVAVSQAAQPRLDPLVVGRRRADDEPVAAISSWREPQDAHLIHDAAVGVQHKAELLLSGLQRRHVAGHDLPQARHRAFAGDE